MKEIIPETSMEGKMNELSLQSSALGDKPNSNSKMEEGDSSSDNSTNNLSSQNDETKEEYEALGN